MMTTITRWAVPRTMTLLYWKWKCHFPVLKLRQRVPITLQKEYHVRLQNNTHVLTHKNIKMKHSRCFLEQETLPALLRTGWFQERITQLRDLQSHSCLFHNRSNIINTNRNKISSFPFLSFQYSLKIQLHFLTDSIIYG